MCQIAARLQHVQRECDADDTGRGEVEADIAWQLRRHHRGGEPAANQLRRRF